MARLIEFFTRGGELVLDPFAGVGGTLLGAAICRSPRRALGFELDRGGPRSTGGRWTTAAGWNATAPGLLADLGTADPGGPRTFDPSGCRLVVRRRRGLCWQALEPGSVDLVATDPPYNPQLKLTMAGGAAAAKWANRRTDYAMISDDPGDLANSDSYPEYLDRMTAVLAGCRRALRDGGYATVIVRDAYQDGRYRFTGADLAARAETVGFVTKGDLIWYQAGSTAAAVRLSAELRAQHRAPAHPGPPGRLNGGSKNLRDPEVGARTASSVAASIAFVHARAIAPSRIA